MDDDFDDDTSPFSMGDDNGSSVLSYEEALDSVRFGKYHYGLTLVAGMINASDAVEVSAISFILPSAEKDLGLTSAQKGWLTSIIFLGMMIGGYAWGAFADAFGRRRCLMYSLAINSLFGFGSAFAPSYWTLLILRFLSGIGVGGSIPVIFTYFCEFLPSSKRGSYMVILARCVLCMNIQGSGWKTTRVSVTRRECYS